MQRIVFSLILLIASAMSSLSMAQDKKFSFDFKNEALTEVIKKLEPFPTTHSWWKQTPALIM